VEPSKLLPQEIDYDAGGILAHRRQVPASDANVQES
jgi:hypothetical protein